MRQMNTILYIIKDGRIVDFERFTCKQVDTILQQYRSIVGNSLWCYLLDKDYRPADVIRIHATPDGYNTGDILAEYTPEQFFKEIGYEGVH